MKQDIETLINQDKQQDIEQIVGLLISGKIAIVNDELKKDVQKRLREIKKNCTIVLSQFKNP